MGRIRTHKDFRSVEKSYRFNWKNYEITKNFPKEELYGLVTQIRRSAVSVAANIAEGAARSSRKEFTQFLYISSGSLLELETELIIAKQVGYAMANDQIFSEIDLVRKMLLGLISNLKRKKLLVTRHLSHIEGGGIKWKYLFINHI